MKKLLIAPLLAAMLVLSGAGSAMAERPFTIPVEETFVDIDPCTGLEFEVTLAATFYVHEHEGVIAARGVRTITTSSGYAGTGTSSFVLNESVEMFRLSDVLANDSGDRIRASVVFVDHFRSGSVRIDRFTLECLG